MNEYKKKKMSYGFYNSDFMTYNKLMCTEQGAQVLWKHKNNTYTLAWLLGEADDFKEPGQYDIVVPDDGIVSVHWDHLQPIIIPTV